MWSGGVWGGGERVSELGSRLSALGLAPRHSERERERERERRSDTLQQHQHPSWQTHTCSSNPSSSLIEGGGPAVKSYQIFVLLPQFVGHCGGNLIRGMKLISMLLV